MEDKNRIIDRYKADCDKVQSRLSQLELAYDNLEIIKASAAEKSSLEFTELKNRVMSLETMLAGEKSNRAMLVLQFEDEQKAHQETQLEMNKLKLQNEDKYLDNQKLLASLDHERK